MNHYKNVMKEVLTIDYYTCDTCDLLITPYDPRMVKFRTYSKWPEVDPEDKHFCTPACAKQYLKDIEDDNTWDTIKISTEGILRILSES